MTYRTGLLSGTSAPMRALDEDLRDAARSDAKVLLTGEIQPVGSDRPRTRVDVRVIAMTNRHLLKQIEIGAFREDLYYRLNVIHVVVPPLRDRRDDIPILADQFVRASSQHHGTETPE